ncbi:wiskott-Aldrich syndrome protein family member 1-like [Mus caroli]|uniref:Wiskott-Aldrich syndrome protein family member 1-like n=1 Tax=Mus caroli TaxID=10089 RepID=A0A6P7QYU4_MUSCR|nr:wiskott-Aldrich syndrome protein family member 1-like [Mus caroli]
MAKFISRASTGCRRKALEGARGDRAGGCGPRKTSGYSQELARRHDAPSTSERLTDLHARPEHTATAAAAAAAAARARAALPRTSPRALPPTPPGRFRLGRLSESQASSREDPALRLRPRTGPRPPHSSFPQPPPPSFSAQLGTGSLLPLPPALPSPEIRRGD